MVFLSVTAHRFCCLHSRPPQGRGSVRAAPRRARFGAQPTRSGGTWRGDGTFDGFPHSRSITRPQATDFAQQNRRSKKIRPPFGWSYFFGAGDEARTRYLDLGKVALYQMSYARKRKIDYTSHRSVCQPRFPNFRKNLMPALAGGHAGIYRMMISTTPGLSALG